MPCAHGFNSGGALCVGVGRPSDDDDDGERVSQERVCTPMGDERARPQTPEGSSWAHGHS